MNEAIAGALPPTGDGIDRQPGRWAGWQVAIPLVLVVLAHGVAILWGGSHAAERSLAFLVATPLLAGAACLYRAARGEEAAAWIMVAVAMTLWSGGMAANLFGMLVESNATGEAVLSMLLFVLYGVPLIFALASPDHEPRNVRLIDATLTFVLGCLFFVHTFEFATMTGANAEGMVKLRLMFDIENIFIALFAAVRVAASRLPHKRAFFATLTTFAFVYMATAAYINHVHEDTDYGSAVDLVIDIPFILLAGLAMYGRSLKDQPPRLSRLLEQTVRAGSPLMLPATLLMVSGALMPSRPALAVAGFVTATLGYGLRSVLLQIRNFEEHDALERLSYIDALTGLANRRQFDQRLRLEWQRARHSGDGLALLMIDIDYFKQLNDTFGHPVGDQRLRDVAGALAGCATRGADLIARYGGEEFAVILPATNRSQAVGLAETMRDAVQQQGLASPARGGCVTVSIGVAHLEQVASDAPDGLIAAADAALYDAKQGGRNQVVASRGLVVPAEVIVTARS